MTDFVRDILYAFRLIRKAPMFDLYVIVPLALGIGLNGAIFLLLDALLLRPLPVRTRRNWCVWCRWSRILGHQLLQLRRF